MSSRFGSVRTRADVAILSLRIGLGAVLLSSAWLKWSGVDDPAFRRSFVWHVLSGKVPLLLALCVLEAAAGCALISGLFVRKIALLGGTEPGFIASDSARIQIRL